MKSTENELENLAKPMAQYLRDNYSPHTTIVITAERIAVVEDVLGIPLFDGN